MECGKWNIFMCEKCDFFFLDCSIMQTLNFVFFKRELGINLHADQTPHLLVKAHSITINVFPSFPESIFPINIFLFV